MDSFSAGACPVSLSNRPNILLAHGGGGRLTQQLIERLFLPAFRNAPLEERHDAAVIPVGDLQIAFTTDSYVVRPLFFPGGDIGMLAVNGTVNDLAMAGARPQWLSAGFIIEEGLPMETLERVVASMQIAAEAAGVQLVTGDTKVVDKGKGDGLFINTAGIGLIEHRLAIRPTSVRPGDSVIISGDLGRHGMAIMSVREGLEFEGPIESDCASVADVVHDLLVGGVSVHCLRDLTRGGLASALNEIATTAKVQIDVVERLIPVRPEVQGACEILGMDPLYVANEGCFVVFVPPQEGARAVEIMRGHPRGRDAAVVGKVAEASPGLVTVESRIGARRVLDLLSGEQLPRIC